MHIVVVAPRCWPDPHPAATLAWHLSRALQAWGIGVSVVGWKSWPGEPDRTVVGSTVFFRLLRPQGLFAAMRAARELALQLRPLLESSDAVVVLDAPGELQPAAELAAHHRLPIAFWLDQVPGRRMHRGPHRWLLRRPAMPRQAVLLCSGPLEEQYARQHYTACGPLQRIAKGVPLFPPAAACSPPEARDKLVRCWPPIPLQGAERLVLIGPPGAARRHRDWLQQLARMLTRRLPGRVCLAVLADAEEPAVRRWGVPGAGPVVSLLPFHDWADLFQAADACLWLPRLEDVPYFALYAMAASRPLLAPRIPETVYLLGQDHRGLRLPWQSLECWCMGLAEVFRNEGRIARMVQAARRHVDGRFTYEAMIRGLLEALGLPLPRHERSLVS